MFFSKNKEKEEGLQDLADIEVTQPPAGWSPEEEDDD